ncbi:MAG TPA: altronate dehydratase family protein, partial [Planctomycetaceae bacterium]
LHPADNVAVARRAVPKGAELPLPCGSVPAGSAVPFGHKVAVAAIAAGGPVRKFGQVIGHATAPIRPGDWVHSHNLAAGELRLDYAIASEVPPPPEPVTGRTFLGYRRPDGRAGTRNYVAILSTVNCAATTSRLVAQRVSRDLLDRYPNVDGVIALTHKGGCALQYGGEDHRQLARTLAGFAKHANVGAYLVLGLGCETAPASFLAENHGLVQLNGKGSGVGRGMPLLTIQEQGGVRKTTEAGVAALADLLPEADKARREPIPVSELILGLECGGSDGYSGVTANPALGVASDLLVAHGGTAILSETSEIYGGEHTLTRRAVSREVGEKLLELVRWWERYAGMFGVEIDNNPSPGNKAGGLTTIYEKSLGAIAKGGSTALRAVYRYAEPVTEKGFVFMDTPGYDPASVTGMVAGGANLVAFTTGRGSCFGFKPVPSLKICTNSPTYERLSEDMDVDAGVILDGVPVEQVGRQIFEKLIAVASGEKTKSEAQGIGDEEFCPWSIGPTL